MIRVYIRGDSVPVEPTITMIREVLSKSVDEIRDTLIEYESDVYPKKELTLISEKYDSMCDKVLRPTYVEIDCTDGGYAGTELEDGETWTDVKSLWTGLKTWAPLDVGLNWASEKDKEEDRLEQELFDELEAGWEDME